MNIRIVLRINAGVILAIGLSLLIPLLLSLLYQDGSWESFLLPAVILIAVGGVGSWVTRLPRSSKAVGYVSNQDVYLSVTLTWKLAAVLGGVRSCWRERSTTSWTRPSRP